MRAKRYIKDIILEIMGTEGCYARDIIDELSERVGEPFSVQRVGSYLGVMFVNGEVRREREGVSGRLTRYKWFRK